MNSLTSGDIRRKFLDFFQSKGHLIVPSAPIVIKNDPTLMFTNAGMNQFKDSFLGQGRPLSPRIADTQKCLRVSGKHNDLEEVGVDTYHHTMFEMLGNWSFGDYFKKEAIEWAFELLTGVYKINKEQLYATVFEGDKKDNLPFDREAYDQWLKFIPKEKIIAGKKKDNFWEMGDTGPCGPCSEVHIDLRTDDERKKISGRELVNTGHPKVIEIWNLVFMEFNRKADGSLEKLPALNVDTGMGFERLCMALQGKQSSYDTDVFQPIIKEIEKLSGKKYLPDNINREQSQINIAMRVAADHIRAISFTIADGQLPSNTGAGYVIRRILRRAVRYGYQALDIKEPFLYQLVERIAAEMGNVFPEIVKQEKLIKKVIQEEETAFLRTLEQGLKKIEALCAENQKNDRKVIEGEQVFELYDTFGFPADLTALIAKEYDMRIDEAGFNAALEKQRSRSRAATSVDKEDWTILFDAPAIFSGYERIEDNVKISRYRKVKSKGKDQYQIVLDRTPFYAESGGQVGDTGLLEGQDGERIEISDTRKENNLILHYSDKLPKNPGQLFKAVVNPERRTLIADNHSATHLLHAALRKVLGKHVEQRGSLVNPEYLRFDFSHFSKITNEELAEIESLVNQKIRENITCHTDEMPIDEAKKLGAMALFGEKYGNTVRVVTFDKNYSIELCGGTHVKATGQIGFFKILSESAVSAGIRRIEAVTALKAEEYIRKQLTTLIEGAELLKAPNNLLKGIRDLLEKEQQTGKQLEKLARQYNLNLKDKLQAEKITVGDIMFIGSVVDVVSADMVKDICFQLKNDLPNLFLILGAELGGKANLFLAISDNLVKEKNWNAGTLIRELSKEIKGGGGGQPFYATAGGTDAGGIATAIKKAMQWVENQKN